MSETDSAAPPPVGQQLAARREALDLSQEALARRIGITSATVSSTERGITEPRRSKRAIWEHSLRLKPGTISRAYASGGVIEPLDEDVVAYANLGDRYERAIWEMNISESDRRNIIDLLRKGRAEESA
jgi:transcriptional regulator with XRE-family HTH domain